MPSRDPIVEEVRAVRDAIAREHDYDLEKLGRALQQRQAQGGRTVVSLPPRRIPSTKKAG